MAQKRRSYMLKYDRIKACKIFQSEAYWSALEICSRSVNMKAKLIHIPSVVRFVTEADGIKFLKQFERFKK